MHTLEEMIRKWQWFGLGLTGFTLSKPNLLSLNRFASFQNRTESVPKLVVTGDSTSLLAPLPGFLSSESALALVGVQLPIVELVPTLGCQWLAAPVLAILDVALPSRPSMSTLVALFPSSRSYADSPYLVSGRVT